MALCDDKPSQVAKSKVKNQEAKRKLSERLQSSHPFGTSLQAMQLQVALARKSKSRTDSQPAASSLEYKACSYGEWSFVWRFQIQKVLICEQARFMDASG